MSNGNPITASTLIVQNSATLTTATISALQPAQSITATQNVISSAPGSAVTDSFYTASTDGFVIGTVSPLASPDTSAESWGWVKAWNSSGTVVYGVGGMFEATAGYVASYGGSLTLPICEGETFGVEQGYYTTNEEPVGLTWWFIPSGTGSATLSTTQAAATAAAKRPPIQPAVRRTAKR